MLRHALAALAAFVALAAPAKAEDVSRAALANTLHRKIAGCWSFPPDVPAHVETVRVKFSLSEAGALDGSPAIEGRIGGDPATKAFAASAVRAVVRCAPFTGLAELAPYAAWKTVVVTFRRPDL